MLRALAMVSLLLGCVRDEPPPAPAAAPPLTPPWPLPAPAAASATPRWIELHAGGLCSWRGRAGGCEFAVVVDLTQHTVTATDPDEQSITRPLGDAEARDLLAMAQAARTEPEIEQHTVTDYYERLDISGGGTRAFRVDNAGPIQRPAAAKLVAALNASAHWKSRP